MRSCQGKIFSFFSGEQLGLRSLQQGIILVLALKWCFYLHGSAIIYFYFFMSEYLWSSVSTVSGLKACGFHLPVANWTAAQKHQMSLMSAEFQSLWFCWSYNKAICPRLFYSRHFPSLGVCFGAHHMQTNRHKRRHAVVSHQKFSR